MTTLGLTQQDEYKLLTGVESRYTDYSQLGPGMIEPSDILEPFRGAGRGLAKASGLVNEAAYPVVGVYTKMLDDMLGSDLTGFSYDTFVLGSRRLSQRLAPDPTTSGFVGQALNSLFDVGSSFTAGFLVGGPAGGAAVAGATTAYSSINEGREKGLDPTTNTVKAAIEGFSVALGARLPASIGGSVGKNMLMYGPGINVLQGVASRGLVSDWLRARGYDELADQYHAFDMQSIAVDAILGGLFGGLGARGTHPDHVDAALVAHENAHLELDTAPGVPKDPASRNAHTAAVVKATEDLLSGKPVKVEEMVRSAEFTEHPQAGKAIEVITKALNDAGYAKEAAEIADLQKRLNDLGINSPDIDNSEGITVMPTKSEMKKVSKTVRSEEASNPFDIYYHGTGDGKDSVVRGLGVHFTRDAAVANAFASSYKEGRVERVRIDIQNPLRIEDHGGHHSDAVGVVDSLIKAGAITAAWKGEQFYKRLLVKKAKDPNSEAWFKEHETLHNKELERVRKHLQKRGYDGIVYDNTTEGGGKTYVAFSDQQVSKLDVPGAEKSFTPQEAPVKMDEARLNEVPAEAADGTQTTAAKAMKDVEDGIKKAENDSKAFDAAVKCFLGIE